ncbi:IS3 family transposase [Corynebacterium sp. MSK195]|uniref:IS3 family transposase n=1 Tax=Corynebacterium sp. MSK195 TaxID=3050216 RepID=UPI00254F1659|nr:IS3 family transposase [Corynebacterium sp. MSK195]MDK8670006.1 IS3 family transposase [Corynebacterium sp. MSK195]
MHTRSSLSAGQREELVALFEQGCSYWAAAHHVGVGVYPVRALFRRFLLHGKLCLVEKPSKQQYSFEIKKEVVQRHLTGESKMSLAREFGLSSDQVVGYWSRKWRKGGDDALKPKPKGRPKGSAKPKVLSEEDKLRRENERLRAENAYLKKIAGLEESGTRLKVQAIVILKSHHRLEYLLEAAGMPRATFFYHQKRLSEPDKHAAIKDAIRESFEVNKHRYGYRRVLLDLRNKGWVVNHKLVYKLMRQMGLRAKIRQRRPYISYAGTKSRIADNKLDRKFTPDTPNTVFVSDVTEFRVAGRKVYLSPVMDLFDRSIVAYTVATSPTAAFTAESLTKAIAACAPKPGWMMHTDQGFQYQHSSWRNLISDNGGVQSMSRKANCYDNAVMESFFGHLKTEMYHGEVFDTVEDFNQAIEDYIQWYNTERIQQRLKGLTPMHYRNQALESLTA